jgi:hypothetical protein
MQADRPVKAFRVLPWGAQKGERCPMVILIGLGLGILLGILLIVLFPSGV